MELNPTVEETTKRIGSLAVNLLASLHNVEDCTSLLRHNLPSDKKDEIMSIFVVGHHLGGIYRYVVDKVNQFLTETLKEAYPTVEPEKIKARVETLMKFYWEDEFRHLLHDEKFNPAFIMTIKGREHNQSAASAYGKNWTE